MTDFCPYCGYEMSDNGQDCPHPLIMKNEFCCPNCDVHFDSDLNEVPIDDLGIARPPSLSDKEYTPPPPAPEPTPPSDSTTPTTPANPSPNFPPAQIALAKQVLLKLQEYQDFSKIKTSIIPIVQSLQGYLARDFAKARF